MDISRHLKELRLEHQLTQEELAQAIFVSRQSVSNWENGKGQPDIENLILLSELYHLSLDDLLQDQKLPDKQKPKFFIAHRFLTGFVFLSLTALICQIIFQPSGFLIPLFYSLLCFIQTWRYLIKTNRGANVYGQGENMYDPAIILWALTYMMILAAIGFQGYINP